MPIGLFDTYDDLYQFLNDWKNRKHLENRPKSYHGFLSPPAIEGILNATGIDYGVPHYQTLPHSKDHLISDQGERNGWEPLPLPIDSEMVADVQEHRKLWCLAYCRVYGLTVTETHDKDVEPNIVAEDKTTVLSSDAVNALEPGDQGGAL